MKFLGINLTRKQIPKISSLRPPIFDVTYRWLLSLSIFFGIFVITGLIGAKFFYYGYSEGYKQEVANNHEDLISVDRLKNTIEKRNLFMIAPVPLPRDPSL